MLTQSSTWRILAKTIMPIKTYTKNLSTCLLLFVLLLLLTACGSSAENDESTEIDPPVATNTVAPLPTDTPIPAPAEEADSDEESSEGEDDEQPEDAEEVTENGEVAEVEETATEEEAPYMGRAPEDMWTSLACSACHQLDQDQTESNRGPVGPHQGNLAERAAEIAPELTPEEYIYNSIVDPNAYVVEGYFEGIMPSTFAEQMTEEEIRAMTRWLLDR